MKHKLSSSAMTVEDEVTNIYADKVPTFENIPVDNFEELFTDKKVIAEKNTCIIIYTHTESLNADGIMTKCAKTDLVVELEDIIRKYNCIPTIRNKKSNTI